jgi:glycosyltransferase involved in cell wall biosynthesis
VIVSDICAGRESVLNGETGLWFRSADVESLVAAMRELLHDGVARRMSRAAHLQYWGRPFTIERHVDALLRVYEAALKDGRKAA